MEGITIVIVNYNVKYFIQQCLQSVYQSDYKGPLQVIVVDNASSDGSLEMIEAYYPEVTLIANKDNVGFSKANNQAIHLAQHPHTLILNPDTILQEDTLTLCATLLDNRPDIGAIGVKMVDGTGTYLPESKRGFPTPKSALFKLTGLSKIFSQSAFFNAYYQGHLSKETSHDIDVLTGAFTYMPTSLLHQIGGFDEDYFMYGEDIELSYQVKERGYKVYYYADTQIIHFKGESTKKLSRRYLQSFYGAMAIYAEKRHESSSYIWSLILKLGIIISGIGGVAKKLGKRVLRPLGDMILLLSSAYLIQRLWAQVYYKDMYYYQDDSFSLLYLGLVLLAVLCYALFGQYDKQHNIKHLFYSAFFSLLGMLSVYSLLPLELRFSRVVLLAVALLAPFILYLSRRLYNRMMLGTWRFDSLKAKRIAIVGHSHSFDKIVDIVTRFSSGILVGGISLESEVNTDTQAISQPKGYSVLGQYQDLVSIVESRNINELIFCSSDMASQDIFKSMSDIGSRVSFKVANNDNTSILGSDSKERVGEWYTLDIGYRISEPFHRRTKRLVDIGIALLFVLFFPIVFIASPNARLIFKNILAVLMGHKTWVGYSLHDTQLNALPKIKPGVFEISSRPGADTKAHHQANLWYARNYGTGAEVAMILHLCRMR